MEDRRKPGRPPGTTQYDQKKVTRGHFMTPRAHKWIIDNKRQIEEHSILDLSLEEFPELERP